MKLHYLKNYNIISVIFTKNRGSVAGRSVYNICKLKTCKVASVYDNILTELPPTSNIPVPGRSEGSLFCLQIQLT